jgi:membrane protein implicated in regulation of membrane protease activity
MKRHRDLIVTNLVALMVLLAALLVGWQEAAAFGLAVLVVMNLIVLIRERQARSEDDQEE